MAQAVSFWLFTLDAKVHFRHNPCKVCGGAGFFSGTSISSCQLSFHQYSMLLLLCSDIPGNFIFRHTVGNFGCGIILLQGFCLHRIAQRKNADISPCQVVEHIFDHTAIVITKCSTLSSDTKPQFRP